MPGNPVWRRPIRRFNPYLLLSWLSESEETRMLDKPCSPSCSPPCGKRAMVCRTSATCPAGQWEEPLQWGSLGGDLPAKCHQLCSIRPAISTLRPRWTLAFPKAVTRDCLPNILGRKAVHSTGLGILHYGLMRPMRSPEKLRTYWLSGSLSSVMLVGPEGRLWSERNASGGDFGMLASGVAGSDAHALAAGLGISDRWGCLAYRD